MNIELTVEQVNTVLAALAKQPLGEVLAVFQAVQQQAQAQLSPPPEPEEP